MIGRGEEGWERVEGRGGGEGIWLIRNEFLCFGLVCEEMLCLIVPTLVHTVRFLAHTCVGVGSMADEGSLQSAPPT